MRILFCNYEYPPLGGGGGVINALLAEELAERHDVSVLTSQGLGLPADAQERGVRIIRVPVLFRKEQAAANIPSMLAYLPMGVKTGWRMLRRERFDVINTHFVLPTGPVGDALARLGHIPHVLSVHGGDLYDPSKWTSPHRHALLRRWVKYLLRRADGVVAQSRNTQDNVHQYYDPMVTVERIPLGIKRPVLREGSRRTYGFADKDILLVTLGRLVARKATDQLISLMKSLDATSARLLVVGTGPQEQLLRAKANELTVGARVHFLGHVDESEKFKLLQMSDIFVSASQHEGFGLVFLEAMACGLPVVCYDHGGQTDFLSDGKTGCVVSLNDLKSFTDQCLALARNGDLRRKMGQENRQRVEEFYIDRCAEHYERLFDRLIAASKDAKAIGDP